MGLFTSNCPGCGAPIDWFIDVPEDYVCACSRPVSPEEIVNSWRANSSVRQLLRDRRAILTVMRGHEGPITFSQILLQAGEGLGDAFRSLVDEGEVISTGTDDHDRSLWSLKG